MKITRRQLRRLIREWFSDEHDPTTGKRDQYNPPSHTPSRGFGWADFQAMAQTGDYEGAGQWLQDLARDRGLNVGREIEDGMIEMGADEYTTAEDLEREWETLMEVTPHDDDPVQEEEWTEEDEKKYQQGRPWEHN